jgi:hypothetical protein
MVMTKRQSDSLFDGEGWRRWQKETQSAADLYRSSRGQAAFRLEQIAGLLVFIRARLNRRSALSNPAVRFSAGFHDDGRRRESDP